MNDYTKIILRLTILEYLADGGDWLHNMTPPEIVQVMITPSDGEPPNVPGTVEYDMEQHQEEACQFIAALLGYA